MYKKEVTTYADRKNEGKMAWELVDFKSLEPMVEVLMFGAAKYSKYDFISYITIGKLMQNKLWETQNVKVVTEIKKYKQKDFAQLVTEEKQLQNLNVQDVENIDLSQLKTEIVELATKKRGLKEDQKSLKTRRNTKKDTTALRKTKRKKEKEALTEGKILSTGRELKELPFLEILQSMDSQKSNIILLQNGDVEYADQKKDYTLTMTIKLESSEICFAVSAIKELDCFKTLLAFLKKLTDISININDISVHTSGRNNWKKGQPTSEILGSLLRHLVSYQDGETIDPESGKDHLGHAMCNLMFLVYNNKNHPDLDDRDVQYEE